jgi:hypothetical protein
VTTRPGAWIRVFRPYLVLAVALAALTATVSAPGFAATAQKMAAQAIPATSLGDEVVNVTWQGFHPTLADGTYGVVVMQCRANPKSVLNDCNTADTFPFSLDGNQQLAVTNRDGTGSVFIDIMTTARLPSLACSESTPCSLLVYETTENGFNPRGLPKNRVLIPLSFARNSADCPPVRQYDFSIESEASAAPALYHWAAALCTGSHAFTMDITNTSSNQARDDFMAGEVDMAVTSVRPEPGELTPSDPPFSVTPLDLTAVTIAYNITDPVTHKQITDLTLTPRLVARLLSDSNLETFFSDPEFRALNPHHAWPLQAADPGIRGEKNADTWIVTNWLSGNANARAFLNGHDKYHVPVNAAWRGVKYPTDVFQARNPNGVYFPRIGEEGVAQRLFADTKPADSVPTDPLNAGFIGILDLPTAEQFRLPIARLTNGVGQPVVTLDGASVAAGFRAMTTSPAGFRQEPAVVKDPNAYPLTKVDQAMVPKSLNTTAKDLRIRALLDYAVEAGQTALPPGYAGLPSALQLQTLHYTGDPPPVAPTTTTSTTAPITSLTSDNLGGSFADTSGSSFLGESSSADTLTTPNTPNTPTVVGVHKTTKTVAVDEKQKPKQLTFVALHLPDAGDRLVVPIVLGLALLAVIVSAADIARRRGSKLLPKKSKPGEAPSP